MASTQSWTEYNGASGTAGTANRTEANWKNVDDSTTVYSSSPITAGQNSYSKLQALVFAGTWNSLSGLTYSIDNASPQTGVTIAASVPTSDTRPNATASNGDATFSSALAANFVSSSTPFGAGTSTASGGGTMYAQPLRTQLRTTSAAAPGDIGSRTITASWTES